MVAIEDASKAGDDEATQKHHVNSTGIGLTEGKNSTSTVEVEGYETASDGEREEEEEESESNSEGKSVPPKDDPYEDALTDEQLKQRALTQANDAKAEGNQLFGAGQYEDALSQYELALQITPEMPLSMDVRSICHANRAACFSKLEKYGDTIKECTKALELNPAYMKALIRRAEAHEKLEHFEEALTDMKKIMELDPSNDQARKGIRRLEPLAAEKREKMKEEMIVSSIGYKPWTFRPERYPIGGKLKEMGNSVLGRFGMSVDNFKAVKDPNTGSYSISFQR